MDKSVLITGADRGLGLSLVHAFMSRDYLVFAGRYASLENSAALERRFTGRLRVIDLDVTDPSSVGRAARSISEQTASLDILINNAGVYLQRPVRPLEELDLTDMHLQRTMDVNAFGALRVTQQFLPLLDKGDLKMIVNITSESGDLSTCRRTSEYAYCMSKAALNIASRILQNYLKPRGMKVLAIHPGWMRTEMGGPEAALNPAEVADGIASLATRRWSVDDEMFMDYRGRTVLKAASWRRYFPYLTRAARAAKTALFKDPATSR